MNGEDRNIGGMIRTARRERGWSQEELGFRADLSQSVISRIERGRNATASSSEKIRNAFTLTKTQSASEPQSRALTMLTRLGKEADPSVPQDLVRDQKCSAAIDSNSVIS